MEKMEANFYIDKSDGSLQACNITIAGKEHMTGDLRPHNKGAHIQVVLSTSTLVERNTTLVNTMKECVKLGIYKAVKTTQDVRIYYGTYISVYFKSNKIESK